MMPRPWPDWVRDLALPRPVALRWLIPTAVALLTFGAFLPTLRNGFVTWDDIHLFVNNPHYRGLGWQEIHWMWTTSLLGAYRPVTWMTYGLDYLLWGLDPFGYHLTNLVLHTAAALAVYVLGLQLFRLAGAAPDERQGRAVYGAAALGALAFGLHPLRAEPVAWVAARGTILGGLLLFLSTMLYLRGAAEARLGRIRTGWLLCAAGVFALALLSRAAGIVLPAVLVVLDVYPLRRLGGGRGRWLGPAVRHVWWEKVPFVVLGAATIPFLVRARMGSAWPVVAEPRHPVQRAALAMFATAFYLKQEVAPGLYAPIRAVPRHFEPAAWRFVLSAVIVVGLTIVLIAWRRRWPGALVAWVCYLVLLAPVSGLVRSGLISPVADRYTYVACVGWALLAGAMGLAGWRRGERRAMRARERVVAAVLVGGVLAGWAAMSWGNVQLWRDSKTLWTYAVSVAPEAAEAHTHLGIVFEMQGQLDAAARQYTEAVRIRPDQARGQLYLGLALARQGRLSEAVGPLRRALALNWPTPIPDASLTLGVILLAEGRTTDAIRELEVALRFAPRSASAHYNLAVALARQGNTAAARAHYREALELRPDLAAAPTGSGALGQGVRAPGATSDPAR